ncbi:MAG: DNA-binding response regulator [Acidobacteria bacterium]|nr:MAG: DNA-binding response regulator [Acidobacteriota bacterium]
MIRTVLVDDEELARSRLKSLLKVYDDIEIVGEAADGEQAMEKIAELKPDLVFLDIQMPGCSGTEVAQALGSPEPRIIFCTAYDQYALEAFELSALDYLLKPVTRSRLSKAIERVRQTGSAQEARSADILAAKAHSYPARILARRAGRYRVIPQHEVYYFAFEEGLTRVHTVDQDFLMDLTITDLENRLNPRVFFRISRAAVINLNHVHEVSPLPGGYAWVTLRNKARLEVSRRRLRELMDKLGQ